MTCKTVYKDLDGSKSRLYYDNEHLGHEFAYNLYKNDLLTRLSAKQHKVNPSSNKGFKNPLKDKKSNRSPSESNYENRAKLAKETVEKGLMYDFFLSRFAGVDGPSERKFMDDNEIKDYTKEISEYEFVSRMQQQSYKSSHIFLDKFEQYKSTHKYKEESTRLTKVVEEELSDTSMQGSMMHDILDKVLSHYKADDGTLRTDKTLGQSISHVLKGYSYTDKKRNKTIQPHDIEHTEDGKYHETQYGKLILNLVKYLDKNYPGYKVFTELEISSEKYGAKGILDLVLQNPDTGDLVIFDFKVKNRKGMYYFDFNSDVKLKPPYDNLSANPKNQAAIQLAKYQLILKDQGYTVEGSVILPIVGDLVTNKTSANYYTNFELQDWHINHYSYVVKAELEWGGKQSFKDTQDISQVLDDFIEELTGGVYLDSKENIGKEAGTIVKSIADGSIRKSIAIRTNGKLQISIRGVRHTLDADEKDLPALKAEIERKLKDIIRDNKGIVDEFNKFFETQGSDRQWPTNNTNKHKMAKIANDILGSASSKTHELIPLDESIGYTNKVKNAFILTNRKTKSSKVIFLTDQLTSSDRNSRLKTIYGPLLKSKDSVSSKYGLKTPDGSAWEFKKMEAVFWANKLMNDGIISNLEEVVIGNIRRASLSEKLIGDQMEFYLEHLNNITGLYKKGNHTNLDLDVLQKNLEPNDRLTATSNLFMNSLRDIGSITEGFFSTSKSKFRELRDKVDKNGYKATEVEEYKRALNEIIRSEMNASTNLSDSAGLKYVIKARLYLDDLHDIDNFIHDNVSIYNTLVPSSYSANKTIQKIDSQYKTASTRISSEMSTWEIKHKKLYDNLVKYAGKNGVSKYFRGNNKASIHSLITDPGSGGRRLIQVDDSTPKPVKDYVEFYKATVNAAAVRAHGESKVYDEDNFIVLNKSKSSKIADEGNAIKRILQKLTESSVKKVDRSQLSSVFLDINNNEFESQMDAGFEGEVQRLWERDEKVDDDFEMEDDIAYVLTYINVRSLEKQHYANALSTFNAIAAYKAINDSMGIKVESNKPGDPFVRYISDFIKYIILNEVKEETGSEFLDNLKAKMSNIFLGLKLGQAVTEFYTVTVGLSSMLVNQITNKKYRRLITPKSMAIAAVKAKTDPKFVTFANGFFGLYNRTSEKLLLSSNVPGRDTALATTHNLHYFSSKTT